MAPLEDFGKVLIILGLVIVAVGLGLALLPKVPYLGRLPGDIFIRKGNFSFYFPIVTCLLLSLILSLLLSLILRR